MLGEAPKEPATSCTVSGEFQKTTWGMSVERVRQLYPRSQLHYRGGDPLLVDESIGEVAGFDVQHVAFAFSAEKRLRVVAVYFKNSDSSLEAGTFVRRLAEELTSRFGLPSLGRDPKKGPPFRVGWECRKGAILLSVESPEGGAREITLNYVSDSFKESASGF
jgi:hypothetical protein